MLDYQHVDDVWRIISERMTRDAAYLTDQERKSILGMELLRLNALQAAHWESALLGDPISARIVLDCIKTRTKITGLESVDPVVNKNLVLVMGDKEDEYIKSLQSASTSD